LIKFTYFILYKEINNTKELAYTFFKIIITNYSLPKEIIFNKNKLFTIKF
ncbi:hypothetical protein CORC01_05145, partial [Colletotrichum orchidophilum]